MPFRNFLLTASLIALTQLSFSQPKQLAGDCTVKARSDAVVILVCPGLGGADVWRAAGEAACEPRKFCNAWMWDTDAMAPATAPVTDAGLPKSNSAVAVAIWANDSKSLVTLRKVAPSK